MDETPPQPPDVIVPPAEPRRPAWEVATLFAGILAFLVLWGGLQWSMNTRGKYAGVRGVAETGMAERMAGVALASSGSQKSAAWKRAIRAYRDALSENPDLPRARRGLAAALYLAGDKSGATAVMRRPAPPDETDVEVLRAWEATQSAFGARPRPVRSEALDDARKSLQNPELGWARYPALMALAPDKAAADAYRDKMVAEYANTSLMWMGGLVFVGAMVFVPFGLYLLDRGLRLPRNLFPDVPVTTAGLVILFVAALLLYQLGPGIVAGVLHGVTFRRVSPEALQGGAVLPAVLVAGGVLGLAMAAGYIARMLRRAGSSLAALGWRTRDAVKWTLGGYIAMAPLLAASMVLVGVLTALFPKVKTPQNPAVDMVSAAHGPQLILVFVLVCVIAPVAEELLFRGLLFRGLEKRYGLLIGALAAGALFAGMHPQLPFGFPPVFALGVGLCYIYRISGSLVPGMLIHALNNGIALALALLTAGR